MSVSIEGILLFMILVLFRINVTQVHIPYIQQDNTLMLILVILGAYDRFL